jgi:cytochrome c peroxidase
MLKRSFLAAAILIASAAPSFAGETAQAVAKPIADLKAKYLRPSSVPFPSDNPYTADKAQLGELLFFDPRLSGNNYISCASCHNPSLSWGDGLPRGIGHGMTILGRRTPTVLNTAWADLLMWDGRKVSLEDQALGPIGTDVEMNQKVDDLVGKLAKIDGYRTLFNAAFPGEGITLANVAKAIATFERTVVSPIAPFDRWVAGDETAISESAKHGFATFNGKANCVACHSGWNFTDGGFHDIGLPDKDIGRGKNLGLQKMQHAFKTPTLRDADRRGPYMHNGSIATLADVVNHYDKGGVQRPSLSDDMKPLNLTAQEKADLVEFMLTLTSEPTAVRHPTLPVSSQRTDIKTR